MSALEDLAVGDEAWVLNGFRSRAFLCKLVERRQMDDGSELLVVQNVDKGQKQAFTSTGAPFNSDAITSSILVPYDDPRAMALEVEATHREFRERVNQIVRLLPEDRSGFAKAEAVLKEWAAYD